ncbi:MAG TPA: DoxX family protein [Pseudorhodoplanes sp.]|jgi:putative oxidoreductase|nr:DoxX family protein [Pseudorhodoplanes sp.]
MNNLDATLDRYQPQILSIFRIMIGLMFLQHGTVKWFAFPVAMPAFANITLFSIFGIAGVIEIVGSTLVVLGLFTRYAAFILSGQMAYTYWIFAARPLRHYAPIVNGGETEVLFCFAFLLLVFFGAGVWSLDHWLRKKT